MNKKPWVLCEICSEPTFYLQTRLCSNCWQINKMIPRGSKEQADLLHKINQYRTMKEARGDV